MNRPKILQILLVIPLTLFGNHAVSEIAPKPSDFSESPGLHYQKHWSAQNQVLHVLEIDPNYFNLKVVHANDQVYGVATVEQLAKKHQAIAGINGGFFHGEPRPGFPAGILKIADEWYGIAYSPRGAIGFGSNVHKIHALIDRLQTHTQLVINQRKFPVHAINQPPAPKRGVLYTIAYGSQSPELENGTAVVIEDNQIKSISPANKTAIPKRGYVYILGEELKIPNIVLKLQMPVKVSIEILPQFIKNTAQLWKGMQDIVGGAPVLISHNRILHDYSSERLNKKFIQKAHARTAVGITKQGHWLFVVVEKNSITGSPGMSLRELSFFMKELGAEHALNLDGGGSSTFYYQNQVLNHPEVEIEEGIKIPKQREVSDAILVMKKETREHE